MDSDQWLVASKNKLFLLTTDHYPLTTLGPVQHRKQQGNFNQE